MIFGRLRMMKFCCGENGSRGKQNFIGQKVWATYNVTVLIQIGLSDVGITSPGDCLHG
jgi:hypothetical protein